MTKLILEEVNEITLINANSGSLDFLSDEPEIYSVSDLYKVYKKSAPPHVKRVAGLR